MNRPIRRVRAAGFRRAMMIGLLSLLWVPVSQGQTTSITSSGLNTHVSHVTGQHNYDITGGTRPGNGPNLFHSFGDFSVGTQDVARFVNETNLPTTNILSRVTGGNPSTIFGEINTTNFPGANLYLINPAGVLFGSTASLNVSGSVHISTADSLRLADGLRFNAIPGAQDTLLSQAPVVAFGFLTAHPQPITVQGSHLSVPEGKSLSLVGGDISVTSGTLTAPGGKINVVSLAGRGEAQIVPEGLTLAERTQRGDIAITGGIQPTEVARLNTSGEKGGAVIIRGGRLTLEQAEVTTAATAANQTGGAIVLEATKTVTLENVAMRTGPTTLSGAQIPVNGGPVTVTAPSVRASKVTLDTPGDWGGHGGDVTLNVQTLTGSQLAVHTDNRSLDLAPGGGNVSLQATGNVTLQDSSINTSTGQISIRANQLTLRDDTSLKAFAENAAPAGRIVLDVGRLTMQGSDPQGIRVPRISTGSREVDYGGISVMAREAILINGGAIRTSSTSFPTTKGGSIALTTPRLTLNHGGAISTGVDGGQAGDIAINVRTLNVVNGGSISSSAMNGDSSGNINIVATRSIFMAGGTIESFVDSSLGPLHRLGDIHIVTPTVTLMDQALVRTTMFFTTEPTVGAGVVLDVGRLDLLRGARIESGGVPVVINAAKSITLDQSAIITTAGITASEGTSGNVSLLAGHSIQLRNGSVISTDRTESGDAGNIHIQAGRSFISQASTISAQALQGKSGTITVDADTVTLVKSQLNTSVTGGPETVAGTIFIDGRQVRLTASQLLSTATEGQGGTIRIRSHALQRDAQSVLDASSQSGTNGTVTIESRP